jgi:hypothetical protein
MRTYVQSIAPAALKSIGLVALAIFTILVVLPAALVAAGT